MHNATLGNWQFVIKSFITWIITRFGGYLHLGGFDLSDNRIIHIGTIKELEIEDKIVIEIFWLEHEYYLLKIDMP